MLTHSMQRFESLSGFGETLASCPEPAPGFWRNIAAAAPHPALAAFVFVAGYALGAVAVVLAEKLIERRRPAAESFASEENPFVR